MSKCEKDCNTPKVLEIHNHECPVLFHRVMVPAAMGDDEANPPRNGQYRNVLLVYEANDHVYLFSSDGIPTFLSDGGQGVDDYNELENKPSINGHELIGDSSLEDLGVDGAISDALEDYTPTADLAAVALSGNYNDLSNTPTIPVVNDATLTITRNNVSAGTFTANSATDTSINIAVPTATSDLTNDSGFITNTVNNLVNYYTKTETDAAIGVETSNRENADQGLQEQIDALASASDVVDVVGTYAELQAYDTSHLNDNDIIKVLTDETHNNAISYYRWDTDTDTFSYIGSQGPFYTKAESDATFVPQTRTVNNKALSTNITLTASDVGALPDTTSIPTRTSDLVNDGADNTSTYVEADELATVATSGSYNDLSNKPTIPAAQVNSDWNAVSGVAQILNKPTIPTATSQLTNDSGFITGYTETDPIFTASPAHSITNADITAWNNKSDFSGDYDDLTNKPTIPTKTSDLTNDGADGTAQYLENDETAYATASIPYAKVDSTSTATAYTATVPGITQLRQGVSFWLENGVVTSASGFTININGLGAKPVYSNLAAATRDTTIFNVNYTMLFVYDADRVSGGAFICYRGYDANTNTIGYQLRTNSSTLPAKERGYRYRLWLTSADGQGYVPINTDTGTTTTDAKDLNTDTPIDPFGAIVYNATNGTTNANANLSATAVWQQYTVDMRYQKYPLTLTYPDPVYLQCTPQSTGGALINDIVQALPTTDDGKIYIYLGNAYSATSMELKVDHPVYYYKDGAIRLWTNDAASISSVAWGDITGTLSNQTDLNTALGTKANSADLATVATSGSYNDLSNKPTIPTVNDATLTIQRNSTNVGTFTANASSNKTINISVPTATSDLTNDSGFLTSSTLPIASTSSLGAVQVGSGLTISSGGVLSATGGGVADSVAWGHITGTLADQTDLTTALGAKANTADLATVATSGSYNDLTNKPTIGNATLTIQKNSTSVGTFTANATSNKSINITVPTRTSDLTNDSGFLTSYTETDPVFSASPAADITAADISSWDAKSDFSGSYNDLTDKPTIPTVGNATLTIQKNGTNVQTFTANATSNKTANITVPTKTSDLTNDSDFVEDASYVHTDNNYTTAEKNKLAGIAAGAEVNVQANWTQTTTTADDYIKNKPTLATVATSGNYNDLSNKPTIPAAVTVDSALSNSSTNPVENQVITNALGTKANTFDVSTALAGKQDTLTAGNHISISNSTISAVDYVHSDDPVSTTAVTPVVTNNMIADGTITAEKFATGATLKLTLSTSDIGEGAALAANTLYGVYQ